ncbi:hypothetical protein NMY22_g18686 [Coprinellus aureogranulatus]|nr:hypothetical protein NMY22_g18686 [Coprinellus aureogranulatus]
MNVPGGGSTANNDLKGADFFQQLEGDSTMFSVLDEEESKPHIRQTGDLSVLESFNSEATHPNSNVGDQNFSFDTIDLTGDTIDLTNLDPDFSGVDFPVDFSMGEEAKQAGTSGNS